MRVQTVMLGPDTDQYGGDGGAQLTIEAIAAAARKAEEIGFDVVTVPEAGHDPFLPIAIAAEHTETIALGTNVAIAFPRSPMVTAQIAWDLQSLSGGRFELGLGTQVRSHVERRYAATWDEPPGPRMREYVQCLGEMFAAFSAGPSARPGFEGEHYRFTLMNPFFNPGPIPDPDVPVYVAAVNPYMARLAGELCHGLRLHPIATFRFTREVVLPAVAAGAERGGRDADDVDVVGAPFLAVGEDDAAVDAAVEAIKQHIAFYATTPTYRSVLEFHGWGDVAAELHQMSREGRWKELGGCITDEMVREWAIVCRSDDLATEVRSRCGGLFDSVLLDLPARLRRDEDWLRETVATIRRPRPGTPGGPGMTAQESQPEYLFEVDEGVGVITLNRPSRLNAITWDLAVDLIDLFRELRQRDDVRTIVLTGAGRAFSSGGDAEWLSGDADRGMPGLSEVALERYQRKTPAGPVADVTRWIVDVDKPVIAAISGPAMGAGLAFALACDRRFADDTTRMCAAMVRLGFAPDCGISWLLPRVTSLSTALMMVETGRILEADECLAQGLIDELVPEGEALGAAMDYARTLAKGPSVAVDLARRFVHKALTSTLEEMLDYEAVAATLSAHTADAREGTRAFVEKRKPEFKGH